MKGGGDKEKGAVYIERAVVVIVQSLTHVQLFATLWTVTRQAPLSMGFPRPEYWSRLPFPSPTDLPYPGIKPTSSALTGDSLPLSHQRSPHREKAYKNHARGNKWHRRCCGSEQSVRHCWRRKRSRRCRLIPGSGRSPERGMAPTPAFLPGGSHGQWSLPAGLQSSWTGLSTQTLY